MAEQITWRNIDAPNFSNVANMTANASQQIGSGFAKLAGVADTQRNLNIAAQERADADATTMAQEEIRKTGNMKDLNNLSLEDIANKYSQNGAQVNLQEISKSLWDQEKNLLDRAASQASTTGQNLSNELNQRTMNSKVEAVRWETAAKKLNVNYLDQTLSDRVRKVGIEVGMGQAELDRFKELTPLVVMAQKLKNDGMSIENAIQNLKKDYDLATFDERVLTAMLNNNRIVAETNNVIANTGYTRANTVRVGAETEQVRATTEGIKQKTAEAKALQGFVVSIKESEAEIAKTNKIVSQATTQNRIDMSEELLAQALTDGDTKAIDKLTKQLEFNRNERRVEVEGQVADKMSKLISTKGANGTIMGTEIAEMVKSLGLSGDELQSAIKYAHEFTKNYQTKTPQEQVNIKTNMEALTKGNDNLIRGYENIHNNFIANVPVMSDEEMGTANSEQYFNVAMKFIADKFPEGGVGGEEQGVSLQNNFRSVMNSIIGTESQRLYNDLKDASSPLVRQAVQMTRDQVTDLSRNGFIYKNATNFIVEDLDLAGGSDGKINKAGLKESVTRSIQTMFSNNLNKIKQGASQQLRDAKIGLANAEYNKRIYEVNMQSTTGKGSNELAIKAVNENLEFLDSNIKKAKAYVGVAEKMQVGVEYDSLDSISANNNTYNVDLNQ